MATKRLQILQALETQLRTITIANGYNIEVGQVQRKVVLPEDASERPLIQIIANTEDISNDISSVEKSYNSSNFSFRLMDYVDTENDISDEGLLSNAIEDHLEDVKKCLWANATLGLSFVQDFGITFVDSYAIWHEDIGIVVIDGFYSFSWDGANP